MTMQELLEEDRERLMTELSQAGDAQAALPVLNRELERLQFRYHEQCEDRKELEQVSYMLSTVKTSLPLVDTVGETSVWYGQTDSRPEGGRKKSLLLLTGGVAAGAVSLLIAFQSTLTALKLISAPLSGILLAASMVCLYLAGRSGRPADQSRKNGTQRVEVKADAGKIIRCLHRVAMMIDQNTRQAVSQQAWEERQAANGGKTGKISPAELDLMAGLLEAACSGDGSFALERASEVKYYLHSCGIEAVDYGRGAAELFDVLPSSGKKGGGTIRPALVLDGRLLKKGLAYVSEDVR